MIFTSETPDCASIKFVVMNIRNWGKLWDFKRNILSPLSHSTVFCCVKHFHGMCRDSCHDVLVRTERLNSDEGPPTPGGIPLKRSSMWAMEEKPCCLHVVWWPQSHSPQVVGGDVVCQADSHSSWERTTTMTAVYTLQPYRKGSVSPHPDFNPSLFSVQCSCPSKDLICLHRLVQTFS